jgi:hypothetical protein
MPFGDAGTRAKLIDPALHACADILRQTKERRFAA